MLKKLINLFAVALIAFLALLPLYSLNIAHAAVGANLIANPSAETLDASNQPTAWLQGGWGTNTRALSTTSDAHTGANSLKASITSYTDGDAKWYFAPVTVSPGTAYTFSDYYKASVPTDIVAQIDNGSGSLSYQWITTQAAAATWTAASYNFTTTSTAKYVTIFHVINSVGNLTIDDAALGVYTVDPVTPPVTPGNLVPNASVETASADGQSPAGWLFGKWGTNTTTSSYLSTGHTGTHAVKTQMTSYTDGDAKWYFPAQTVLPSQQYQFTDYYQADVETEVYAAITKTDGTTQYVGLGKPSASTTWAKFTSQFSTPSDAVSVSILHTIHAVGYLVTDDFSMSTYTATGFNRGMVSLTFDDGWTSIYTNGLPLLKKYGLVSTQYIVSGFLNDPSEPEYMTNAQVKAFAAAGNEIGSHSVSHPDLTTLTAANLKKELVNSKSRLKTLNGGKAINNFASPYGSYNSAVIAAIKAAGYKSHRGVEPGFNSKDSFNIYDIKVQNIENTTTPAQVQAWVNQALASKTWLVLVFHQVDSNPAAGEFNTLPSDLDTELSYIKTSGITTKTMQQALAEITPQL